MKPIIKWCGCKNWKVYAESLQNQIEMKFCVFCGKKLVKK